MRKSLALIAGAGFAALTLAACGSGSGAATTGTSASSSTSSGSPSPISPGSLKGSDFCKAFRPLLALDDPTGPDDPAVGEALSILADAQSQSDSPSADVDAVIAIYAGVQDGSVAVPVDINDPVVADAARAIQEIIAACDFAAAR